MNTETALESREFQRCGLILYFIGTMHSLNNASLSVLDLWVIDIATVAQRIQMSDGIFCGFVADQIAVRIVIVTCDYCALCIHDGHYIVLKIGDVVVENTIVLQRIGIAIGIVEEVQRIAAKSFPQQSATGIIVSVLNTVDRFAGSQTVGIIGVADGIGSIAGGGQSATLCPCECPAGGVARYRVRYSSKLGQF